MLLTCVLCWLYAVLAAYDRSWQIIPHRSLRQYIGDCLADTQHCAAVQDELGAVLPMSLISEIYIGLHRNASSAA